MSNQTTKSTNDLFREENETTDAIGAEDTTTEEHVETTTAINWRARGVVRRRKKIITTTPIPTGTEFNCLLIGCFKYNSCSSVFSLADLNVTTVYLSSHRFLLDVTAVYLFSHWLFF